MAYELPRATNFVVQVTENIQRHFRNQKVQDFLLYATYGYSGVSLVKTSVHSLLSKLLIICAIALVVPNGFQAMRDFLQESTVHGVFVIRNFLANVGWNVRSCGLAVGVAAASFLSSFMLCLGIIVYLVLIVNGL